MPLTTLAPGKVNLCLLVGAPRADGLHPLVSVVQPTDLADEVSLEPADRDEVICPGVDGPNLALRALEEFRFATAWEVTAEVQARDPARKVDFTVLIGRISAVPGSSSTDVRPGTGRNFPPSRPMAVP